MITVIQFGEGNFIRAFFDWMLQKVNEAAGLDHEVFIVQPIPQGRVNDLLEAGGNYNVLLRGFDKDKYLEVIDKVEVIKDGVNPFKDYDKFLRMAEVESIKIVVSNTTEAGIYYKKTKKADNYPSMLTELLYRRYKAGLSPLYILPLELIENNGQKLKECILKYAKDWDYPEGFFGYLEECKFYNTLVDRIVPGFPKEEAESIFKKLGYVDKNLVSGEYFHFFAIQGDVSLNDLIPFDKARLNVVFTDNLKFYRDRKVRILNGSHTAMVPVGLLNGIEYVRDFVEHSKYGKWLNELMHKEIVPAFNDDAKTHAYADEILMRFKNPALKHSFKTIALNSISKMNTRIKPTLVDYYNKFKRLPDRLTEAIAYMVKLYSFGETVKLPVGELKLSDYKNLKGFSVGEILESFFPDIENDLKKELIDVVQKRIKA